MTHFLTNFKSFVEKSYIFSVLVLMEKIKPQVARFHFSFTSYGLYAQKWWALPSLY